MKYGVEILISAILIILILFVVGYIIRKRYYKEIDRLDSQKLELMNRPIAEEMAKVKQLNMTGETEEMFERWRDSWDDILNSQLPQVDEMIFAAEEFTDKYRFKQAKEESEKVSELLKNIEKEMDFILNELDELVGSEEKNRKEIAGLLEQYQESRKYLLAHRHLFGEAGEELEKLLESVGDKVKNYENLTDQGNYLQAREVVLALSTEMEQLVEKMEKVPDLLTECQTILPSQIDDIKDGYKEMTQQGFILDHLQMEKQIETLMNEIILYQEFLHKAEVKTVEEGIQVTKDKVETLYNLLEKEVYAKHYILQETEKAENMLEQLIDTSDEINHETQIVQNSYQLLDEDLEIPKKFDKTLSQMVKRYELLKAKLTDKMTAYSLLEEELKEIQEQLQKMKQEQQEFTERLHNLRKDELEAKESVYECQRKIKEIIRLVHNSYMPGLPADCDSLYDRAEEQIENVYKSLNEKPLNMKQVQKFLNEAKDTVDHLYEKTEEYIETAQLAERVIQYANRYRRQNPELAFNLKEAEQLFRNYEYMAALEQAATAVEKVEPGALKRIEEIYESNEYSHS
ncbi:septation ring formation regulator EzrA [Lederbergia sp. NSJ-179]|uniref:septation ring formation regulator EzrA n=1 Tax=Lederbergia sp. NSJ-179 TaxID=2931402 RepID=UPI001FD166BA|nr:septation ring formation regulator EzrA [Lederbergia sp. NSJ-179]MCJ7839711.1 septation ring formation regulator EzrA [Lederbergia sp. NSJ-179]